MRIFGAGMAARKLDQIEAAKALEDLRSPPGNGLEALKGERKGQHSIRINDQFRVCFSAGTRTEPMRSKLRITTERKARKGTER